MLIIAPIPLPTAKNLPLFTGCITFPIMHTHGGPKIPIVPDMIASIRKHRTRERTGLYGTRKKAIKAIKKYGTLSPRVNFNTMSIFLEYFSEYFAPIIAGSPHPRFIIAGIKPMTKFPAPSFFANRGRNVKIEPKVIPRLKKTMSALLTKKFHL